MPQFSADEAQVASAMAGARQQEASAPEPAPEAPPAVPETVQEAEPKLDYREFDPKHREAFTGLLYVGHLDDEFEVYGHTFRIATPTQTERLQIGPIIKEFQDTVSADIAYQAAITALYLVSIDGKDLPQPVLTTAKNDAVRDRFNWVTENLKRPVVNVVCDRCWILEAEVDATLEAMGKASA